MRTKLKDVFLMLNKKKQIRNKIDLTLFQI